MKNFKIKIEGPKAQKTKLTNLMIFILIFVKNSMLYMFFFIIGTGSNPADIYPFRSHNENIIFPYELTIYWTQHISKPSCRSHLWFHTVRSDQANIPVFLMRICNKIIREGGHIGLLL